MEQYTKSLGELNAVEYLHDYIDTYLTLTFEEETYLQDLQNYEVIKQKFEIQLKKQEKKRLKALGLKRCKKCNEILPVNEFHYQHSVCKKCYNKQQLERIKTRQKIRLCKECLQIKPVQEFTGRDFICKQCKSTW